VGVGFEFFGNASGALLYGKASKDNETFAFTDETAVPPTTTVLSTISDKKHNWRVVPTAQLLLGIGWGDCFNCSKLYFGVRAGWEVNYYWNLPGFLNLDGNQAVYTFGKNLDLSGLTVDFRIEF
jgi:hypothetical protein